MSPNLSRNLLLLIAGLVTVGVVVLSVWLSQHARQLSRWETDRATLHSADYGMLDGDQWVSRVAPILADRIENFEVTEENRPQMRALMVRVIERLIDELPNLLKDLGGGLFGNLGSGTAKLFLDNLDLKKQVPKLADKLIDELEKPETKKELIALMHDTLSELAAENIGRADRTALYLVQEKHQCGSIPDCDVKITAQIDAANQQIQMRFWILCGLAASLLLLGFALYRHAPGLTGTLLVVGGVALLTAGVLAPMIQIDARLAEFEFVLLGEGIRFSDQVLYFQSKSILDVIEVLARSPEPEMLLVAGLIALFSIGFPGLKMAVSLWLSWRGADVRLNGVMRFFAWQSGKWAMADVFVVAVFMAYLGIRGLVSDQLSGLQQGDSDVVSILTTNNTALEPGFWAFLLFALFGIVLGMMVQRRMEGAGR